MRKRGTPGGFADRRTRTGRWNMGMEPPMTRRIPFRPYRDGMMERCKTGNRKLTPILPIGGCADCRETEPVRRKAPRGCPGFPKGMGMDGVRTKETADFWQIGRAHV